VFYTQLSEEVISGSFIAVLVYTQQSSLLLIEVSKLCEVLTILICVGGTADILAKVIPVSFSPSRKMPGKYFELFNDNFLPYPLQCIIY
jgi:hypothetical protein